MLYNGYNVILSDGGSWGPKPHSKNRNQGKITYHNRIQKKWRKRWGLCHWVEVQKPGEVFIMRATNSMVIRKDDWSRIKQAIDHA